LFRPSLLQRAGRAVANRTDSGSTFDNLNRATAIQGTACTNDILGNRLTLGAAPNGISYTWDAVNRLASYQNGAGTATTYQYRADGMRVSKMVPPGVTTRYRYDGQMGIEDTDTNGNVKQYGLGARGIESITNPAAGVMYPIYDGHGNMTATICRSGTNSFTLANQRSYDAWGLVRSGSGSGDPTGRYCANLGHKQDDESGLIYMRARYYEPASGRFLNEDPKRNGWNWTTHCENSPVGKADVSGKLPYAADLWIGGICVLLGLFIFCTTAETGVGALIGIGLMAIGVAFLVAGGLQFAGEVLNNLKQLPAEVLDDRILAMIDMGKTEGGPLIKIMAHDLDIAFWLAATFSDDN
jgi:RHS repeat-associated protein